jgi:hypothetical protein
VGEDLQLAIRPASGGGGLVDVLKTPDSGRKLSCAQEKGDRNSIGAEGKPISYGLRSIECECGSSM